MKHGRPIARRADPSPPFTNDLQSARRLSAAGRAERACAGRSGAWLVAAAPRRVRAVGAGYRWGTP